MPDRGLVSDRWSRAWTSHVPSLKEGFIKPSFVVLVYKMKGLPWGIYYNQHKDRKDLSSKK